MGMPQESQFELGRLHNGDLILDNEYVTLWYYPELKIVHHRMHQMPDSTAFRELLSAGANVVERHRAPKWLSDDRNNTLLRRTRNGRIRSGCRESSMVASSTGRSSCPRRPSAS